MITADQIVIHAIGDYVLQSDWMANEKTRNGRAALTHSVVYALCFIPLLRWNSRDHGHAVAAFLIIWWTHYFIDRYRLARYVVWAKNFIAPTGTNKPWADCSGTGYPADRPAWLAVWLLIFADNILHICINGVALKFL